MPNKPLTTRVFVGESPGALVAFLVKLGLVPTRPLLAIVISVLHNRMAIDLYPFLQSHGRSEKYVLLFFLVCKMLCQHDFRISEEVRDPNANTPQNKIRCDRTPDLTIAQSQISRSLSSD